MDIKLGQTANLNFDKKIESKSQSSSIASSSSFAKKNVEDKNPSNGFSSKLEKSLDKKGPENKQDSAPVAKKQEYSRNSKINPPKEGEVSRITGKVTDNKNEVKSEESAKSTEANAAPADLAWLLNMNMAAQVAAEPSPEASQTTEKVSDISMDKKIFDPKVQGQASAEILPVLKFMKAMAENFKIPPEKIMQAFESLPPETLMLKPQAAVTELMQKLNIQPRQFTKAQILFNQMVSELEQVVDPKNTPDNDLKGKPAIGSLQANTQTHSAHSDKMDTLKDIKNVVQELNPSKVNAFNMQAPQQTQAQLSAIDTRNMSVSDMEALLSKLEAPSTEAKYLEVSKGQNLRPMDFDSFVNKMAMEQSSQAKQAPLPGAGEFSFGDDSDEMSSDDLKEEVLAQIREMPTDKSVNIQKVIENAVARNSPEVKAENAQMLSKEAQILVQKGGGEMKIQLRPEGMGDVLLKVKVQDGQVGIQMTADSIHSKKLLESSLSELKLNLAEHKLHLSDIKVDVSDKMKDNFENQNSNFNRDNAREFLGQFRQQNENFRSGFFNAPGARGYNKVVQSAPDIQPTQTKTADNGRLYLVA